MAKPKGTPNKRKSEAVQRTIIRAIGQGNTLANAAMQGGIAYRTLCKWRTLSDTFNHAVTKAEAEAESLHVNAITSAGVSGNWQASAWWLERRRTGDWRKPSDRLEVLDTDIEQAADRLVAKTGRDRAALLAELRERTAAIDKERKAG